MKIIHVSDTHGSLPLLCEAFSQRADLIIHTGDFLPNYGRVRTFRGELVDSLLEESYQQNWLERHSDLLVTYLKAPLLLVRGNHDFVSPSDSLRSKGASVLELSDNESSIQFGGLVFGGFRQIPFIIGEWSGEEHDLSPHIQRALQGDPNVLVTHTPPAQILCDGYGCPPLSSALFYGEHRIRTHLFGHAHNSGGIAETGGITFSNAACTFRKLTLGKEGERL